MGHWNYENEALTEPGKPPMKLAGSESVRSLGGVWVLCEGQGQMPDGGTAKTLMTLGYDAAKKRFVGTFIGSGLPALNNNNVNGQVAYQPGFDLGFGWKFSDGSAITFDFFWLSGTQYANGVTLFRPHGRERPDLADTFISSFVYNFPPEYSGPANKIVDQNDPNAPIPSPTAVYGLWHGASIMTIKFEQRFQQIQ